MHRTLADTIHLSLVALAVIACAGDAVAQGSWAFAPGAYTHDQRTGTRTAQYASHEPVEGLPDPRLTVSRYWRTRTNLRGADGSQDTIYEVRSFGNTLGGFDAQRERGFDAQLETLDALRPFRFNPYLFFGGLQGFGYGTPGYPAAVPGTPVPATGPVPPGAGVVPQPVPHAVPQAVPQGVPQSFPQQGPYPGQPGTAYPFVPQVPFAAPPIGFPFGFGFGGAPGFGSVGPGYGQAQPWWGYGPGRGSYYQGR
ncbi:MAG: hypothetical protein AAF266_11835 [Planctomycetota bacterium]